METITEAEFIDNIKNSAVKRINITQGSEGYQIVVILTWKKDDLTLVTTRGKPREWASLDRLIRHLRASYEGKEIPSIGLSLNKPV